MEQVPMKVKVEFEDGKVYEGTCCRSYVTELRDEFAAGFSVFRGWDIELTIRPKPVHRWRWWYVVDDYGHIHESVTNEHYTENEFLRAYSPVEKYECVDATKRVDYE